MSAEVPKFLNDPLLYVAKVCINLQTGSGQGTTLADFNANFTYAPCYFDLAPWSTGFFSSFSTVTQVMLVPTTQGGPDLISGYYVPYIAYGSITSSGSEMMPLDDVPATDPPYDFIFTGGQNGCSLLLMTGSKPNTVCALHYPNSDGKKNGYPLLKNIGKTDKDILIAIDFDLYGEAANPNACSFFYYKKEWIGVTQSQIQGMPDMEHKRPTMSINKRKGVQIVAS
jgi:hypothetical protein